MLDSCGGKGRLLKAIDSHIAQCQMDRVARTNSIMSKGDVVHPTDTKTSSASSSQIKNCLHDAAYPCAQLVNLKNTPVHDILKVVREKIAPTGLHGLHSISQQGSPACHEGLTAASRLSCSWHQLKSVTACRSECTMHTWLSLRYYACLPCGL